MRLCKECATRFEPASPDILLCPNCFDGKVNRWLLGLRKYKPPHNDSFYYPLPVYVYAWYEVDDSNPFYIGIGKNSRYYDLHLLGEHGPLADCEKHRQKMESYRVDILFEGLERKTALAIETLLIEYYRSIGVNLTNRTYEPLAPPIHQMVLDVPMVASDCLLA